MSPQEQELRRKELHRQRQQRYAERQKELKQADSSGKSVMSGQKPIESSPVMSDAPVTFTWKLPFQNDAKPDAVPPKPLTEKEADTDREKLIDLYMKGSSLLDDVLEIVVKDHEPVSIWALSDEEAALFVDIQLARAKVSKKDAEIVRRLVILYERLVVGLWATARIKATVGYVGKHGGLSFR